MNTILSKVILAFVLAGPTLSLRAADQPPLNENLKPLKAYLGNWNVRWTEENGQSMAGKATLTADAGGNIVTFRIEAQDKDGRHVFTRVSVFFWQAESKSLAEVNFDSNGLRCSNVLVSQTDDKLVWQGHAFSPDGKPSWGSTEMVKKDENTWTGQFVRMSYAGAPLPDGPKATFTRAK